MIRVGLARCRASYEGLMAPWGPGKSYPEIERLLGDSAADGPPNEVYDAVRSALHGLGLDRERFGTPEWNPIGDLEGAPSQTINVVVRLGELARVDQIRIEGVEQGARVPTRKEAPGWHA